MYPPPPMRADNLLISILADTRLAYEITQLRSSGARPLGTARGGDGADDWERLAGGAREAGSPCAAGQRLPRLADLLWLRQDEPSLSARLKT
jgi:hypothetical protein